ncbi:hypothetical protein BDV23DRAFT_175722 [Aspergillus alliaceus]|uniref:Uncharacterized protein n=1 Tax=Petromyces alliaceus TaxID=209559 RepID=A0A5N7BWD1_PETAA|nr:hypothetical protein BDV23DRAFT_175722 [Aspergillus alliaceus]
MPTKAIQGYAVRRNDSRLPWHACCPHGSYCPSPKTSIANQIFCADSSWNIYDYNRYFSCAYGDQVFGVKDKTWVGCLEPVSPGSVSWSNVKTLTTGQFVGSKYCHCVADEFYRSGTPTSSSTSSQTSNPATKTSSPDHESHTNTGAIAGGVVGGVAGAVAIIGILFFIWRHKRRQNLVQPQGPMQQYPAEIDGRTILPELMALDQPKNHGIHELS